MEKLTITEALAEVKLIEKKIAKKEEVLKGHLARFEHVPDPFERDGGSEKVLAQELQSIDDHYSRLQRIRGAIAKANLENEVTLGESRKTIHEWLVWKREVFTKWSALLVSLGNGLKSQAEQAGRSPTVYKEANGETKLCRIKLNMDTGDLMRRIERVTALHEQLDGKLSLKNATIVIEF